MRVGEQLALPLERQRGTQASARVPFPIAWHKVRRAVRRSLKRVGVLVKPDTALQVFGYLEQQALLEQIRQRARCRARNESGRNSACGRAVYAASPEGRRVERIVRVLSEQIREQERTL